MYASVSFGGREIDRIPADEAQEIEGFNIQLIEPEPKQWYTLNLSQLTIDNMAYRRVVKTGRYHQIVLMSLKPGEEIGMEVHPDTDQFIRIEAGVGKAVIDGKKYALEEESAIEISAGSQHNIINTGSEHLKLYTIYSPPHHHEGLVEWEKIYE